MGRRNGRYDRRTGQAPPVASLMEAPNLAAAIRDNRSVLRFVVGMEQGMDLEQLEGDRPPGIAKARPARLDLRPGEDPARLGVCKYRAKRIEIAEYYAQNSPPETVLDTLRHEIAHAIAGPPPSTARGGRRSPSAWGPRPGRARPRARPWCSPATGGRPARPARRPSTSTGAREPDRLPLPVRGPLAADLRVHGRPGPQARRAPDRPGVGPLGGDVCGLRGCASAGPQAEGGRLAVQVPPPLRDRLAAPVLRRRLFWGEHERYPSRRRTIRPEAEGETDEQPLGPVIRKPAEGRTIAVVGDVYRFLATGEDTNGKYAMWEAIVPPGGGPPPHVHSREEEGFYILEGEITFTIDGERIVATAGMFANMPVGTPHSFKNESDKPAKMLISVAPAGLEQMFFEVGVPLAEGATTALPPTKEEIEKLLAVAPRYGIEIRLPTH